MRFWKLSNGNGDRWLAYSTKPVNSNFDTITEITKHEYISGLLSYAPDKEMRLKFMDYIGLTINIVVNEMIRTGQLTYTDYMSAQQAMWSQEMGDTESNAMDGHFATFNQIFTVMQMDAGALLKEMGEVLGIIDPIDHDAYYHALYIHYQISKMAANGGSQVINGGL